MDDPPSGDAWLTAASPTPATEPLLTCGQAGGPDHRQGDPVRLSGRGDRLRHGHTDLPSGRDTTVQSAFASGSRSRGEGLPRQGDHCPRQCHQPRGRAVFRNIRAGAGISRLRRRGRFCDRPARPVQPRRRERPMSGIKAGNPDPLIHGDGSSKWSSATGDGPVDVGRQPIRATAHLQHAQGRGERVLV